MLVDGVFASAPSLGRGEVDEGGTIVLNPAHFTKTDDGEEHTDTGARCDLQVLGDGVDHLGSPSDLRNRDDEEDDTFNQHSGEGNLPIDAHAEHDGEGEVGVQAHSRCECKGKVGPQTHDHTADKGGDGRCKQRIVKRNTADAQHRWVHEQDVRHRQEGRQSGSQFAI